MKIREVHYLPALTGVSFLLNTIGVFTPNWVQLYGFHEGIVPYQPSNEYFFIAIASWLMYLTVALSIVTVIMNWFIYSKVNKKGFSPSLHKTFITLAIINIVSILFDIIATIELGVAITYIPPATSGFSPWLCVVASVINLGIVILSFRFAYWRCWEME